MMGPMDFEQNQNSKKTMKNKTVRFIRRYAFFLVTVVMMLVLFLINPVWGKDAALLTTKSLREMILIIPPIFILLGLLDVWVPREILMRYMGTGAGVKGVILSLLIGSAAAGPLYGAFPVAAVLMKKGASFTNILIFMGAWSTTKIPMVLFEVSSLGLKFAITRLMVSLVGIFIITFIVDRALSEAEKLKLYDQAAKF
jgi:uncharacterized membrane protein YraQ (UPF0718 family)